MSCTETNSRLDDYIEGELSTDEVQAIEKHLANCDQCSKELQETGALRRALNSLPLVEPSEGFEERLFQEVQRQYANHGRNRFYAGFVTAMAASLALWFASTLFIQQVPVNQPQVVMVALHDAQTVRLKFDAPADIEQVTLSIGLPANMELQGYAGYREISWQTRLKKGQNILALPLKAVTMGEGELVAHLNYGNKSKQFRIILKTAGNGVFNYQIQTPESV